MPVVRTRSYRGVHGLPFLDGDLGQVDPLIDLPLDTASASSPLPYDPTLAPVYGPQPTQETVATNELVAGGYIPDPGLTPPSPTTSVPSSGYINAATGLPMAAPSGSGVAAGLQTLPPGPAPRVNVPLSTSSLSQFFTGSTLFAGIPNAAVLGFGVLAMSLLFSGGGGRRRRR